MVGCCSLCVVGCLLFVVCCGLCDVLDRYVLFVAWCLLVYVCCVV